MALIKCTDCGKEISDKAKSCPNCGCPVSVEPEKTTEVKEITDANNEKVAENKVPPVKNDATKKAPPVVAQEKKKISAPKFVLGILGGIAGVAVLALLVIFVILPLVGSLITYISDATAPDYSETEIYNEENYVETNAPQQNVDNNNGSYNNNHSHYYVGRVTQEATCSAQGIKTYTCDCGAYYTEPISQKSHSWESATCTTPRKCKNCGATDGSEKGHSYSSEGTCYRCGQSDPMVQSTLSKCSLIMPSVPQTIHYKNYKDEIQSSVNVTGITYQFEYEGEGTVSLTGTFSGTKTYDKRGAGQSDSAKIGWKIYDSNGNVIETGTFYSPSVAEGESFSDQEVHFIYGSNAIAPGTYRLEIINVN